MVCVLIASCAVCFGCLLFIFLPQAYFNVRLKRERVQLEEISVGLGFGFCVLLFAGSRLGACVLFLFF